MPYRPISARADGLLSLLGIKNLGRNPDLLMESVQPTIDAQNWYLRSAAVGHALPAAVASFTSEDFWSPFLLASDEEWLYVHYAAGLAFTGGGVGGPNVRFLVMRPTPGVIVYETPIQLSITSGGAETAVVEIRDFWIPPSFGIVLSCGDLVVGTTSVRVGALVTSVRV